MFKLSLGVQRPISQRDKTCNFKLSVKSARQNVPTGYLIELRFKYVKAIGVYWRFTTSTNINRCRIFPPPQPTTARVLVVGISGAVH